jgi:hypothetical protein
LVKRTDQFSPCQLLNFSAYPEWHTEWLKSIEPKDSTKTPQELSSGDKIEVNIENFKFVAEVKVR